MSETYCNNLLFEGHWNAPFELVHEQHIAEQGKAFNPTRCLGGRVFTTTGGSNLFCIDPQSKSVLWQLEPGEPGFASTFGDADHLFANLGFCVTRLDFNSGDIIWQGDPKETVYATADKRVFTAVSNRDGAFVQCRDMEDGELLWKSPLSCGSVNELITNGSLVLVAGKGFLTALDSATGAFMWQVDEMAWCHEHRPDQLAQWNAEYSASRQECPIVFLGPMNNERLYLSIGVGVVVAMNPMTGDTLWINEFPLPLDSAQSMIYRQGKLYCNRWQGMGNTSYLSCINAEDGALVFRHEEDFSPGGCANPIMLDNLFLGGGEGHGAAFDVDAREFAWRHSQKGSAVFTGTPCPIEGGFVVTCRLNKTLLWFESAA